MLPPGIGGSKSTLHSGSPITGDDNLRRGLSAVREVAVTPFALSLRGCSLLGGHGFFPSLEQITDVVIKLAGLLPVEGFGRVVCGGGGAQRLGAQLLYESSLLHAIWRSVGDPA